jgi:hypothetical protein
MKISKKEGDFMIFRKKGGMVAPTGSSAAVLIAFITLFIVLYILFLPSDAREELLSDDPYTPGTMTPGARSNATLFESGVGRLEHYSAGTFDHLIPSVYLFQTISATEIKTENPFFVRRGWFNKEYKTFNFSLEDAENTDNVILSFTARKHEGTLRIILNGHNIYEYDIATLEIAPIPLPNKYLGEENMLEFEVDNVGIKFWKTNEYAFENFKIIGDITDVTRQQSSNIFTVTETEKYNLEAATLRFTPRCTPAEVGTLEIFINNRKVFNAIPDCNTINRQDLSTADLTAGKNTIIFKTTRGDYSVESIKITPHLKDVTTFIEYFEVTPEQFDDLLEDRSRVYLEIDFVDDAKTKRAKLNFNGHLTFINQKTPHYTRLVSPWIEEGNNYIEVTPETTLNIVELRVITT